MHMDIVLVWVCCNESRCQFLVIQAFRDMPGSHGVRSSRGYDIFDAAEEGNVAAVRHFLRAEPGAATATNRYGSSAQCATTTPGDRRLFQGRTALHNAAIHGHAAVCRVLLAAGAQIEAKKDYGPAPQWIGSLAVGHAPLGRGRTPLHLAAYNGRAEAVKALLEANASVAATDNGGRGAFDQTGDVDFGAPGVVRTSLKTVDALIWRCQFQKNGVKFSLEGLSFHTLPLQSHSFKNCFDLHNA